MILMTGANGFIGTKLCKKLKNDGSLVQKVTRRADLEDCFVVDEIGPATDWSLALPGVDRIIHLAARVHVMNDSSIDSLAEYRRTNVEGTLNLARQAAKLGVKRFVYLSSIKVNGEQTWAGKPFTADDVPAPIDPYGISKYEAERGLMEIAEETGLEVVIIRPVLVYGPGVKANFLNMMRWLYYGIPLPFGLIKNRRSLVALDNLIDLIVISLEHPRAANQVFLVSDDEDMSTTELLRRTANALGKTPRLLPVPQWLLASSLKILGKHALAQRLCGSLQVDINKTKELLGWKPPLSVDEALKKTAEDFLRQR